MMLIAALVLPGTSWRVAWLVAAAAAALMLLALLLRAVPAKELDPIPARRHPVLAEMRVVATSGGTLKVPLALSTLRRRLRLTREPTPTLTELSAQRREVANDLALYREQADQARERAEWTGALHKLHLDDIDARRALLRAPGFRDRFRRGNVRPW